jgi:hypothetical protein
MQAKQTQIYSTYVLWDETSETTMRVDNNLHIDVLALSNANL